MDCKSLLQILNNVSFVMNCNSLDILKGTNHMYLKMIEFDLWASIDAKPKKKLANKFSLYSLVVQIIN